MKILLIVIVFALCLILLIAIAGLFSLNRNIKRHNKLLQKNIDEALAEDDVMNLRETLKNEIL